MKLSIVTILFVALLSVCSSQYDGDFTRGPWCFPGPPGINCQDDSTTLLKFSYGAIVRDGEQFMRFTLINYNDKWMSIGFADSTTGSQGQMVGVHAYIDGSWERDNDFGIREYTLGTNTIGTRNNFTSFINYVSISLNFGIRPRRTALFERRLNTSDPQHFHPIRFDGELCFLWAVGTTVRLDGVVAHSARGLFCDTLTQSPTTSPPASSTTESSTRKPSGIPSIRPTSNPTMKPSLNPSLNPTSKPTAKPSGNPTMNPSVNPTGNQSGKPTKKPTSFPTARPTMRPTEHPSVRPTNKPTELPTNKPSSNPTASPSNEPTKKPSAQPTTTKPTGNPATTHPTNFPTNKRTQKPSSNPTENPTKKPTSNPTSKPTNLPTTRPTEKPTRNPTGNPTTTKPTKKPTFSPSANPTNKPTQNPSKNPSRRPSMNPTNFPVTSRPLFSPTRSPSTTKPTKNPTRKPTQTPSSKPTSFPTLRPTRKPSQMPFPSPTQVPSRRPTTPTQKPTKYPTQIPTVSPTFNISVSNITDESDYIIVLHIHLSVANYSQLSENEQQQLFQQLSEMCNSILDPSVFARRDFYVNEQLQPSTGTRRLLSMQLLSIVILSGTDNRTSANEVPQSVNNFDRQSSSQELSVSLKSTVVIVSITSTIIVNTKAPSTSHSPTNSPSLFSTANPTKKPSLNPTEKPTEKPSGNPTMNPSANPTGNPSGKPTKKPTSFQTARPTTRPTEHPSGRPTNKPTELPTNKPTSLPTSAPTDKPSSKPTSSPSMKPSGKPTSNPTLRPSNNPQASPTRFPTFQTSLMTMSPTRSPTQNPTVKNYSKILQYNIQFDTQKSRSLHKFLNDSNHLRNRFEFTIRFSFEEKADNISVEIVKINDNYPRKDYSTSYQFPTTDLTTHFKVIANIKVHILDETLANSYTQDMMKIVNRANYKENFRYGIGYNIQWTITITYLLLKTLLIGTGAQRKETDPIIFGMELTWPVVVGTAIGLAICCFGCGVTCLYCLVKEKLQEVGEKSERTQRGLEFPNSPDGKSVYLPDTPIVISEAQLMMKISRDDSESTDSESDKVTGELI